ncbi:MAG TPA: TetR/AcrR family transcriptional regulator [Pseudomonadales bacterium]
MAQKRDVKLAEIVVAATRLFNRRGFLATTMEEIAQAVGMNPATLYHYVQSKEDLAYRAYLRGCERRHSQLQFANDPKLDGLGRIRRFLECLRQPDHRPAILSEVGALRPEWADHVRRIQRGNIAIVQSMVARGIRDGSVAPSDPQLTGIGILSVVEWMAFWYNTRLPYSLDDAISTIEDVLINGVTPPDAQPVEVAPITPAFPPQPAPNPFDRAAMTQAKLEQFLRTAMESFNAVGVHATSIDQCAAKLNLTKGAFYYYFRDKEELLYLCYKRALRHNWQAAAHIETADPVERELLWRRSLFERHISEYGPFPTYHHVTFLREDHRREVMDELMRQQQTDVNIVQKAMDSGVYRPMEAFLVEKVRAGLTNWFPTWYSQEGRATPSEVADNHSRLFLYGLKPR